MNERLRQLRKQRGVSISFVSASLGFKNPSGYANIEYGLNRLRLDQAKKVADLFNVTVDELIG